MASLDYHAWPDLGPLLSRGWLFSHKRCITPDVPGWSFFSSVPTLPRLEKTSPRGPSVFFFFFHKKMRYTLNLVPRFTRFAPPLPSFLALREPAFLHVFERLLSRESLLPPRPSVGWDPGFYPWVPRSQVAPVNCF